MDSNSVTAQVPDPKPHVGSEDESADLGMAGTIRVNPQSIRMEIIS